MRFANLVGVVLAWLFLAAPSVAQPAPTPVEEEELSQHIIGDRVVRGERGDPRGVAVKVTIGADGSVVEATFEDGPDRAREAALRAAREWHYRPFLRDGRPVAVIGVQRAAMAPPEAWGPKVPFPEGDLSSLRMRLERLGGGWGGPIYSVEIRGDGTVVYIGGPSVLVQGEHRWRIPVAGVEALLARFRAADFFSAKDRYRANWTDQQTNVLSLRLGDSTHSVVDYMGMNAGMPAAVYALEDAIDEAAGVGSWIEATPQTLSTLAAAGLGPRSPGAGAVLVQVAHHRAKDLTVAMLDAGYPINGTNDFFMPIIPRTLVGTAAWHGWLDVVQRLIAMGALERGPPDAKDEALWAGAGRVDMVREILRHRPDVNARDAFGQTALMRAADAREGWNPPNMASLTEPVRLLLAAGADPNLVDRHGESALFKATYPQIAELLVNAGARLEVRSTNPDHVGDTPLTGTYGRDYALYLIRAGANIEAVGSRGTIEAIARKYNWPEVLQAIEDRRARDRP